MDQSDTNKNKLREYHFRQIPCSNENCNYIAGIELRAVSESLMPKAYRMNIMMLCPICGNLTDQETKQSTKEFKFS